MGQIKNIKLHIVTDIKQLYKKQQLHKKMEESKYFIRELDYSCGEVNIYQATIGDVGHVVWDAALALSKFLDTPYFRKNFPLPNKLVVELGAGTGLVGLIGAKLGATVYATDLEELVPLIQKNIDENSGSGMKGSMRAVALKWGESGKQLMLDKMPDIVLIADCVYYDESLHPLIETLRSLCGSETSVYISYEDRDTEMKIKLMKNFFEITRKYFVIEEVPLEVQDPQYS